MAVRPANKSTSEVVTASNNAKVGGFLNMTKNNTMIAAMQKNRKSREGFWSSGYCDSLSAGSQFHYQRESVNEHTNLLG
jgi:hypothetical protein